LSLFDERFVAASRLVDHGRMVIAVLVDLGAVVLREREARREDEGDREGEKLFHGSMLWFKKEVYCREE
jgi:hypothetical protein